MVTVVASGDVPVIPKEEGTRSWQGLGGRLRARPQARLEGLDPIQGLRFRGWRSLLRRLAAEVAVRRSRPRRVGPGAHRAGCDLGTRDLVLVRSGRGPPGRHRSRIPGRPGEGARTDRAGRWWRPADPRAPPAPPRPGRRPRRGGRGRSHPRDGPRPGTDGRGGCGLAARCGRGDGLRPPVRSQRCDHRGRRRRRLP